MATSNENLKRNNEKIFKTIEKKLSLNDEKSFIEAANKVTAFLKDPRAYYEGGRPLIGNICKAARATLTRLANSGGPFYSGKPFPKELQPRVTVYTVLIETVLQHSNRFVHDHPLNEEMVEIFSSVMSTFKESKSVKSNDKPSTTPVITDQQTQGMLASNSSALAPPASFAPVLPIDAELKLSESDLPSALPTTASVPPTFQKNPIPRKGETSTAKSAVRPKKKPKLGRATVIDSKLLQEDLNWYSSKQRRSSENLASPAIIAEHGRVTPPGNITDDIIPMEGVEMTQNNASKLPQSGQDYLAPVPLTSSATTVNIVSAALHVAELNLKDKSSFLADTRPSDSDIVVEAVHSEALAQSQKTMPLKTNRLCGSNSITMTNATPKSTFGPATIVFVSINPGQNTGESVNMDFELTPNQRELLSLWQTRDEHDRDTSIGICLSLACYKVEDALESGFDIENKGEELITSPLLQLKPSWPTNSMLSAYVGQFKIFLAPPVQLIDEKLVDITRFIEGNHVQICLDHAGDMRGYIFALIAHPPTPSQIYKLGKKRAKTKDYQLSLESLRITFADVFG